MLKKQSIKKTIHKEGIYEWLNGGVMTKKKPKRILR